MAIAKLMEKGSIEENPFNDSIAAVSVGIFKDQEVLDLNYLEDRDASVDFNVVNAVRTRGRGIHGPENR